MNGTQPPGVHRMAAIALWQIVCYNETNRSLWRCWDETNCIFIMAVLILKSQLLYVMTTLILSFKIINKFNL